MKFNYKLMIGAFLALMLFTLCGPATQRAEAASGFQICDNAAPPNCAPVDPVLGLTIKPAGVSFRNITTATTTTVKSGAGVLHSLCVNKFVASATVTIYDNTAASGTLIATITNPATLLDEGGLGCDVFDAAFSTGLTIVTVGAQDITATYR